MKDLRHKLNAGLAALVFLTAANSSVLQGQRVAARSATHPGYEIGEKVEDFRLKSTDNAYVSLADYPNSEGYIVIFTCNHCPYAQRYEQRIIDLHNKYAPKGWPLIAINSNCPELVPEDSFVEMQKRARARKYPFPYVIDQDQEVFPKFGADRTPHAFLLDANWILRYKGGIDDNPENSASVRTRYLEDAIHALMRDEKPRLEITKSPGCLIRYCPK